MDYNIDYETRVIQLVNDYPAKEGDGASFSNELVNFDRINNVLGGVGIGNALPNSSMSLQTCFDSISSNNGPMLAAALMHLKVIDSRYVVIQMLP